MVLLSRVLPWRPWITLSWGGSLLGFLLRFFPSSGLYWLSWLSFSSMMSRLCVLRNSVVGPEKGEAAWFCLYWADFFSLSLICFSSLLRFCSVSLDTGLDCLDFGVISIIAPFWSLFMVLSGFLFGRCFSFGLTISVSTTSISLECLFNYPSWLLFWVPNIPDGLLLPVNFENRLVFSSLSPSDSVALLKASFGPSGFLLHPITYAISSRASEKNG